MKVGDWVKLHTSKRRNGKYAGKSGLVVSCEDELADVRPSGYSQYTILVEGDVRVFHKTQFEGVVQQ